MEKVHVLTYSTYKSGCGIAS